MAKIKRREFIEKSLLAVPGFALVNNIMEQPHLGLETIMSGHNIKVLIPMPLQIVIDDVGWWSGEDWSKKHRIPSLFR